jgi:fatty acid desaturase
LTSTLDTRRGSDYAELSREIRAAKLLDRRRLHYAARIVTTGVVFAGSWFAFAWIGDSWYQTIVAAVLGIVFTQLGFLGHDGAHQQIAAKRSGNDMVGLIAGNLLTGLSIGWWIDKHNRHHANPNKEDHDPDIGDGVLAFTTGHVAKRTGRLGRAITRRQAWLFFPLLTLEGFNLHVASIQWLIAGRTGRLRRTELALLTIHNVAYFGAIFTVLSPVKALAFIAIHQGVFGLYMGCSFAPNHKGMRIIGPEECLDYLRRQVLTSRNVRGGRFVDFVLGGLNYQIEHHLFPSMPRPSLRRARPIVRAYCAKLAVPYDETSLIGSYVVALRYLHELGQPLRVQPALDAA